MDQQTTSAPPTQDLTRSELQRRSFRLGVLAAILVAVSWGIGIAATYPGVGDWYAELRKPWFAPALWARPPITVTLYALMAFALWRVLVRRRHAYWADQAWGISAFLLLLLLNAGWPWLFWRGHSTLWGVIDLAAQILMLAFTIFAFARLNPLAALTLVLVMIVVIFLTVVHFAIWYLN